MTTWKSTGDTSSDGGEFLNRRMVEHETQQLSNLVMTTIVYPMEYAKVLMQLGHEPIPPRESTTLFGKPALILPNVIQYIGHIRRTDGILGCYNGLSAKLLGSLASAYLSQKLIHVVGLDWVNEGDPPNIEEGDEADSNEYFKLTRLNLITHTAGVVISYPFQVVSIRMMASFIGREESYGNLFLAIRSVFRDHGISGFFHGIVPKLIGELSCIATAGFLSYLFNKYVLKPKEHRGHTIQFMTFIASTFTYPLAVVSTCMSVCDSVLVAGQPPLMPIYSGWYSCWRDLVHRGQHKRGGSMILRYYVAPYNNVTYSRYRY